MSFGGSVSSPGALCAQGTKEPLLYGQGVQKSIPSLLSIEGHLSHISGDLKDSSSAQGVIGHVPQQR